MVLLSSTILVIGGVGLFIYSVITRFVSWYRLRHIPGPPGVGWSRLWLLRHLFSGRLCNKLKDVCDEYGPLVRIGPDWVVCSDASEIRRIWGVRSGYYRSPWYKAIRIDPTRDSILTFCENKTHHRTRSYLLPGYAAKGIENQEQVIDEQVGKLVALIRSRYISTRNALRPWNMGQSMQYLTQDVITAIGFGKAVGYLDADTDIFGFFKTFRSAILPFHCLALLPTVVDILQIFIMKPFVPKATDKRGAGWLMGIVKTHVDKRYGPEKVRNNDVLQSFVDSGLSQSEVEVEALVQLLSGTDTTATALRNIIFYIATHPRAYRLLQEEIDAAAQAVTRPVIADQEAKQLPYLQACIKETLRLWPPIMGMMGKISDEDDIICGIRVPAKTQVAWAPLALMKDRVVFGEDARTFEPQRWIDADPEQLKRMEATHGLVFAVGTRWECLGKRLAYMEMEKTIFELFRRFDFVMLDPVEPFKWKNYGLTIQHDMNVKITSRGIACNE
ncbi:hypothetical protein D8B26_001055 [Coccidioides posadasii str. Silveira]|uniref:Cytochrome P450 11B2 n=2 Tax=Coccidioides posadasii TaxID=199306 RepID=E9CU40_COCPS|nr:cytochrome P450 11B2 [Coccidioides posadasii str. Silveira]KMM64231.1 cytochrome P450 11B2 [Coccidioides posadasii RMSCC 3488]QVM06343.1 hypothetical protein D8B26_001055 [Coccidioides posadasii str. Silveira]